MIANAIAALGILSPGVIIGVFVAALAAAAAREDKDREQYRAGFAQGERNGYMTGWRAARRAWGGRRSSTAAPDTPEAA